MKSEVLISFPLLVFRHVEASHHVAVTLSTRWESASLKQKPVNLYIDLKPSD